MQAFDTSILLLLNGLARESWTFDAFVMLVAETALLKDGVLVALLWWAWERGGEGRFAPSIVRTLAGALTAVAAARALQNWLPARPRPLHDPALAEAGFVLPYDVPSDVLHNWSSFPSDHAVLAFALATALFLAHRGVGAFAYAWALLVTCSPRVYVGFHYPSDIAGGAAIGTAIMLAATRLPVPTRVGEAMARLLHARRGWAYAGLFLLTCQTATVFEDTRNLAGFARHALAPLVKPRAGDAPAASPVHTVPAREEPARTRVVVRDVPLSQAHRVHSGSAEASP